MPSSSASRNFRFVRGHLFARASVDYNCFCRAQALSCPRGIKSGIPTTIDNHPPSDLRHFAGLNSFKAGREHS